jgi:hypothetical protein
MTNFEEKFSNWRHRMNQKTDREKHNYALTVALFLTAIVFFFVASRWYFEISGKSIGGSFFTDIEEVVSSQKQGFLKKKEELGQNYKEFVDTLSGAQTVVSQVTTSQATTSEVK